MPLARLARSGALPAVSVPQGEEEAMRDLTQAREETLSALKDAKLRLQACLLSQDSRSVGWAHWGPAPLRWLSEVVCPPPAQPIVFQAYVRALTDHPERLARLEQALTEHVQTGRLAPVVDALQALRGGPCTVAVPPVAARGALTRLANPRQLRHSLG